MPMAHPWVHQTRGQVKARNVASFDEDAQEGHLLCVVLRKVVHKSTLTGTLHLSTYIQSGHGKALLQATDPLWEAPPPGPPACWRFQICHL